MQNYHRTSDVFIPGGMPSFTYIARAERKLEEQLREANDNLCKLVTVTGATKSGKTVLTNRIFPRKDTIWIDGGTVGQEDDFWQYILQEIGGSTSTSNSSSSTSEISGTGSAGGETGIPFVAKGQASIAATIARTSQSVSESSLSLSARSSAIAHLRQCRKPLIVDDFHYLNRSFQGNIIRALKPLIFDGHPVILIAIPHRRYDAVKVEREITGRLQNILVPAWELDELAQIPQTGFPLLNTDTSDALCNQLAYEAYGSPHLMQEFCRQLARINDIYETQKSIKEVTIVPNTIYTNVAESTGKVIFDKLAKGPRQRADRIQRRLKNGDTADLYEVTLLALANLQPGLETVGYESLRGSIRDILAQDIPQAREVTRVLEKMMEIASSDEASIPVIDWEKEEQKLHITDPFFAFYLKWGLNMTQYQAP